MSAYRDAGVDIDAGNRAVELMAEAIASTASPAVLSDVGAFGGLFAADGLGPGKVLAASTDGVGTKVELAARHRRWRGIGHDLVNHCVDDILVQGAEPLFFLDYVASDRLEPETIAEIVTGMAEACRAVGCALLGGETAEMPGVYAPGAVDVAGTIVGVVDRDRLLPRTEQIGPGDVLVAMPSVSPHTNGYSLIRKLVDEIAGDLDQDMLDWLLTSHRCHRDDVAVVTEHCGPIKALAHITGGGFFENIPRVLPATVGARIELGSWSVPDGFARLVEWGELDDAEAFRVWNMGVGMVAVCAPDTSPPPGYPVIGALEPAGARRVELVGRWR